MIKGTGIDLVEIERISDAQKRQPRFYKRILTESEQKKYLRLNGRRQAEYLAGRFAAKEAFAKALGTGIGEDLSFQDAETSNDDSGKPVMQSKKCSGGERIHLSITHSKEFAAAQVIIESLSC
ncbi:holo-ACP synthase [Metabacillus sp. GX 13764]|uniref:holo-ACP synthase n=1 Tax=Metabacillus kandeliae TaxID=2900151 RepID=UPI001E3F6899|nr:holo-ACP synthase [Metabacillus kandeliae]MCD7036706.1 holo-ACP synthase [Metabacillus kandeliae]